MSSTISIAIPDERRGLGRFTGAISDALVMTWRGVMLYRRVPQLLIFSTIQPVIFVLLFRYVFGGVVQSDISVPYAEYLMPGIFVQMTVFGAMTTSVGLATDLKSGLLERFHALPMARSAVLAGRTTADLVRNVFVLSLVTVVGFAIGFRVHTGVLSALAGMALVLLFAHSLSWVFAGVGLAVGDPETAQAAGFPVMAPLVFASSAFVPVASFPGWLQAFAEYQPVSVVASAVRALMLGELPGAKPTTSLVLQSLAWIVGIIAVAAPLAVRRYRNAV
jgi:ABC-2 type transport system permease protein/oleandomycin transport system permease protein